ncbi:MAG: transposase [Bacteroidales bacterium]|nr:transposase [Bacteroidales bacterium]
MANKRIPMEADKFYHIYNHAVGNENLFRNDDNFNYFMLKYKEYCNPIVETYAYCLMPNHFHLLISMKNDTKLIRFYKNKYPKFKDIAEKDPTDFENPQGLNNLISLQTSKHFGNFFNAYAKAFNKQQQRRGSLFEADFRRIEVSSDEYLRKLAHYIHYNPIHHGFTNDIKNWKFSSYRAFLSSKKTHLAKQEVINWFDDLENLIYFHKKDIDNFKSDFD